MMCMLRYVLIPIYWPFCTETPWAWIYAMLEYVNSKFRIEFTQQGHVCYRDRHDRLNYVYGYNTGAIIQLGRTHIYPTRNKTFWRSCDILTLS